MNCSFGSILGRFLRIALISAAVIACLCGCQGQQVALVGSPPVPIFGPRTIRSGGFGQSVRPVVHRRASTAWKGWVPRVPERPWRFVVIHHSATTWGSAAEFDRMHRARGWDELGYHFVIGNGTGSGDGQVEIGSRWRKQRHGAHCKVAGHPEYNDFGIGICLVGHFNATRPTAAQMDSLVQLLRFLKRRYRIPNSRIFGHGQLKATDCPGKYFSYRELFARLR